MIGLKIVATGLLVFVVGFLSASLFGGGPITAAMLVSGICSVPLGLLIAIWA